MLRKPTNDVIAFIESREMARNANPSPALSAVSSYRRTSTTPVSHASPRRTSDNTTRIMTPNASDRAKTATCPDCGQLFHIFTEMRRGWNTKPHERCKECWRPKRGRPVAESSAIAGDAMDMFGQGAGITVTDQPHPQRRQRRRLEVIALDHHIFTKGEWRRARLADHPRVRLNLSVDSPSHRSIEIDAIADSCAQSKLWSLDEFISAGFDRDDLSPVTSDLKAVIRCWI